METQQHALARLGATQARRPFSDAHDALRACHKTDLPGELRCAGAVLRLHGVPIGSLQRDDVVFGRIYCCGHDGLLKDQG